MSDRNLIITGGAGFIGSSFVRLAASRGYRVTVLDSLTYAGLRENLTGIPGDVELVEGDIRDTPKVSALLEKRKPQAVVNFAAESHVDRSIEGPGAFIETNVAGTYSLLSSSLHYWKSLPAPSQAGFRFLQISTDEVFGALGAEGKFSETTPYAPSSPYSASKASADHLVMAWHHTYGLPTLITNCSNNYGPRQFPEKLIPLMIESALQSRPLPVYGKGTNVRDWIHVEDHCAGVLRALESGRPGQAYCLGGNAERRNIDVVQEICSILDRLSPRKDGKPHKTGISFVTDRLGHDFRYAIDDQKARRELGDYRNHTFETGLEETVRWYLSNREWCRLAQARTTQERINK